MTIRHFNAAAAAALIAGCFTGTAVHGRGPEVAPSITVPYDDLDLTAPVDAAQLDRRILKATVKLCAPVGSFESVLVRRACIREVYGAARARARTLAVAARTQRESSRNALVLKVVD